MPHAPDTHITTTPKHVYINGKPVSVTEHGIKLSDPDPTDIQTVTLTVTPTTVTILNEDNPDTIDAAREAVTRSTRDEAGDDYLVSLTKTVDMLDTLERQEATRIKHTRART